MRNASPRRLFHLVMGVALFLGACSWDASEAAAGELVRVAGWQSCAAGAEASTPADLAGAVWSDASEPQAADRRVVWFRTRLPERAWRDPALTIARVRYKLEAFIGTDTGPSASFEKFFAFGDPTLGARAYEGEPMQLLPLPRDSQGRFVYLRIASEIGRLGFVEPVLLGERGDQLEAVIRADLPSLAMASVSLLIGIAAFGIFFFSARLPVILAFGVFSFGIGMYGLCHTDLVYLAFPRPLVWDHLQYTFTYLTPFAFLSFVEYSIEGWRYKFLKFGKWFFAALSPATQAAAALGLTELPQTLPVFQASMSLAGIGAMLELGLSAARGNVAARLFGLGATALVLAAVHDVLTERHLLPWVGSISPFVGLLFMVLLAIQVGLRLGREFKSRVAAEKEIETAGIYQTKFMPESVVEGPGFSLHVVSRAAANVGGDWYVHRLVRERWLHVHVGDVTGHGAAAALLATFAKGALDLQYEAAAARGDEKPELDQLHTQLNGALCRMGASMATMTVISVSIDLTTGLCEYVNSGHPAPKAYSPATKTLKTFVGRNTSMLGVEAHFSSSAPSVLPLSGDETLLLFSDGLAEVLGFGFSTSTRRTAALLARGAAESPRFVADLVALHAAIAERARGLADDVTVIIVRLALAARRAG